MNATPNERTRTVSLYAKRFLQKTEEQMKTFLFCMTTLFILLTTAAASPNPNTYWVDDDAGTFQNGTEAYPFLTIAQGVAAAGNGDEVRVKPGTYNENVAVVSKNITIKSHSSASDTVIDGGQIGSVVSFSYSESTLDGFTITNGKNTAGGGVFCSHCSPSIKGNFIDSNFADPDGNGGGIFCGEDCWASITGNVISNNTATLFGGGIYCIDAEPLIEGNTIASNSADSGAGVAAVGYSATTYFEMKSNTIQSNVAVTSGGGLYCSNASPTLDTNTLYANETGLGAGVYCDSGSGPVVFNCVFRENYATSSGAGLCCSDAVGVKLTNNTFYGNTAGTVGGAISSTNSSVAVTNTIMRQNTPQTMIYGGGSFMVSYSCFEEATGAGYNISADPMLVDPDNGDFHIPVESPCVDTGSNDAPSLPDEDYEGDARIHVSQVDMGADECIYPSSDSLVVDVATISVSQGGIANFSLNAGPSFAGDGYFILGGISGTVPGTPLPSGEVLPLNWDMVTEYLLELTLMGFPMLPGFHGTLDAEGKASAMFIGMSLNPDIVGLTVYFAFTTFPGFKFASNAVQFQFVE